MKENTPVALAVAEKNGVTSEQRKINIDWEAEGEFNIDPARPAFWTNGNRCDTATTQEDLSVCEAAGDFEASGPDELWVTDITYVPTASGFLYLSVVVDAFSRAVVAQKFLRVEDGCASAYGVGSLGDGDGAGSA